MQASLGNAIKGQGDNEDVHFEDDGARQRLGRGPGSRAHVREHGAQGRARARRLGVPWSRIRKGDRKVIINGQPVTITERAEADGLMAQRDFGGTKKWRTTSPTAPGTPC